jgi:hypothetical protein
VVRLLRVLVALARHLPDQLAELLPAERFADGRAALARLGDPDDLQRQLGALGDEEAGYLTTELLRRWAAVAPVTLDPLALLSGPATVRRGEPVTLALLVEGLDDGWTVAWSGAQPGDDQTTATVVADAQAGTARVTARVMGRGQTGRTILTPAWTAPVVS